jgi:D-tyrosyl-tRNA(Tyr) deacylase
MRLILQRVRRAAVEVEGEAIASIDTGLLVLVGVEKGDDESNVQRAVDKLTTLRLFADSAGKMNLSAGDVGGRFLIVSQFTLAGSLDRGRRPSFDGAAAPEVAEPLVELLAEKIRTAGHVVEQGRFGAYMLVELVNDGPVTFVFDT